MERWVLYLGVGVVGFVVLIVALRSLFVGYVTQGGAENAPAGEVYVNVLGRQITLRPVEGRDTPCVGAPPGYTRVFFEDQSGVDPDMKASITVGYVREGDHMEEALSWVRDRAAACGFTKVSEQSVALPGARGTSLKYSKGDNLDLTADVGVIKGSDGREYTVVRVGYDEYAPYEEENEEVSPPPGEAPEEVALPQSVQGVDAEIRPVLESVFGGAYPTEYSSIGTSHSVAYQVGRYTESKDAAAVSTALENEGWKVVATHSDGSVVEIGANKDNTVLQITFDLNTKRVDVLWVSQS